MQYDCCLPHGTRKHSMLCSFSFGEMSYIKNFASFCVRVHQRHNIRCIPMKKRDGKTLLRALEPSKVAKSRCPGSYVSTGSPFMSSKWLLILRSTTRSGSTKHQGQLSHPPGLCHLHPCNDNIKPEQLATRAHRIYSAET